MKQFSIALSICFAAIFSSFAAENDLSIEALLRSDIEIFIEAKSVAGTVADLKNFQNLFGSDSLDFVQELNEASGIDIFNVTSLQNAGIDVKRSCGFAIFNRTEEEIGELLIPTTDAETLSNVFKRTVAKLHEKDADDEQFAPTSTSYKNFKIDQLDENIFTTSINNYFVIGNDEKIVKSSIDIALSGKNSLAEDSLYLDYEKKKNVSSHSVSMFVRGTMFAKEMSNDDEDAVNVYLKSIKYIIAGTSFKKDGIALQVGVFLDNNSSTATKVLSCLKTGTTDMILVDNDSVIYSFLSLDLQAIDKLCQDDPLLAEGYMEILKSASEEYGVDLQKDVIPYGGVFNTMVGDIMKNEFVVYCPMNDASKSLALGKKIQAHMKSKYEPEGMFGYEAVGSYGKAAYYFDSSGKKNYVYSDQRGLYVGNSIALINAANKRQTLGKSKGKLAAKLTNEVWSFAHIKKNELLFSAASRQLNSSGDVFSRIGDMNFYFKKADLFLSLDADIAISALKR